MNTGDIKELGIVWEEVKYGKIEDLKEKLLYKKIVEWNEDYLLLEDGTRVTLECSEQDCCAGAGGNFKNVKLDAVITDVIVGEMVNIPDEDTNVNETKVVIYHNRNEIAQAEMIADAGNGGYYYSVGSVVVNEVHYPIVNA